MYHLYFAMQWIKPQSLPPHICHKPRVTILRKKFKKSERDDETLPIIEKIKAPKKGGIQGTKWKDPRPRRQKNHLKWQTTRGTSSSQIAFCHKKHI
jgi:hypothetical protein